MILCLAALLACLPSHAQGSPKPSLVNWESPHVHPLDLTPAGERLLAVNTPDARLEVFDVSEGALRHVLDVPVGLDPVSVRSRSGHEAWVVNHVSDSVSVVDLRTGNVVRTLATEDEPCDVIFAWEPERALVTCSEANCVLVFDPEDLDAPPRRIPIEGEDPRGLAKSPDGRKVYVAVFESGNASTILGGGNPDPRAYPPDVVNDPAGPYGGRNPPPNAGDVFNPPINPENPPPPPVGLIVKRDPEGRWRDDNGADWTDFVSGERAALSGRPVGWDLADHDVAILESETAPSYVRGLLNLCMAIDVNPKTGQVAVVGTDAINHVRFEPVLRGRFLRVELALAGNDRRVVDLNPHLDYLCDQVEQEVRNISLGDPRGIAWRPDGKQAFVTGMGSNNLLVVDAAGNRVGAPIEVGEGPTGVVVRGTTGAVYVLNKFESSISQVDPSEGREVARVPLHDPSSAAIKRGRKHLYDTHATSGLGHSACASCHVDSRMDRLAWDLGDPAGRVKPFDPTNCGFAECNDHHPMKGPMLTQTLQDIIGKEPHHWRGDRTGLEEFADAFMTLLGDDEALSRTRMQELEDFLATIHFPPNPFRNLDNSLPARLPLPGHYTTGRFQPAGRPLPDGNARRGLELYRPPHLLDGVGCSTCHTLPTGLGADSQRAPPFAHEPIPPGPRGEHHHARIVLENVAIFTMKIPHLRNLYERVGFNATQVKNTIGFGYGHNGGVDSIERLIALPRFEIESDQDVADLLAFMLAFSGSDLPAGDSSTYGLEPPGTASQDTHAAVGRQITLVDFEEASELQRKLLCEMLALADTGAVSLVVKGRQDGEARGYAYLGNGTFQSDRAAERPSAQELRSSASVGSELTWTIVPSGTEVRIGIDRDEDGVLDGDERDAASDPANRASRPEEGR